MPLDYADPVIQRFVIECNRRANKQRTKWFLKNKDELIRQVQCKEKQKHYTTENIEETRLGAGMSVLRNLHEVTARHRRRCAITGTAETTTLNLFVKSEEPSVMKPVDIDESSILYKDLSAGGGRMAYLFARKHKLPEEKYNDFPTTSNMYGWALRESSIRSGPSKHKRYASYFRDVTRISGVHPDPPHYNQPAASHVTCKTSE